MKWGSVICPMFLWNYIKSGKWIWRLKANTQQAYNRGATHHGNKLACASSCNSLYASSRLQTIPGIQQLCNGLGRTFESKHLSLTGLLQMCGTKQIKIPLCLDYNIEAVLPHFYIPTLRNLKLKLDEQCHDGLHSGSCDSKNSHSAQVTPHRLLRY